MKNNEPLAQSQQKAVWFVLQKILNYSKNLKEEAEITYDTVKSHNPNKEDCSYVEELNILEDLKHSGIIVETDRPDVDTTLMGQEILQLTFYFKISLIPFKKLYHEYKSIIEDNNTQEKRYKCGKLVLDLKKALLQYLPNKPLTIQTQNQEVLFLEYLMQHKDELSEYTGIARYIGLRVTEEDTNKTIARDVQFIRKKLITLLFKTGIQEEALKRMLFLIKHSGYKLTSA